MINFADLYFGAADAENEPSDEFIRSFVDHRDAVGKIRRREKFLLLGPKGVGKTAIARYFELISDQQETFVSRRDISELPLDEIERLKTGESSGIGRTVTAWKLLLLCSALDLVLRDQSSSAQSNPDVARLAAELRRYGFMDPTLKRAVVSAAKSTLKIHVPGLGDVYSRESQSALHLNNVVPHLETWVAQCRSDKSYYLFIDGLDSIYLSDPRYAVVVSALLQAAYSIHQDLRAAQSSVHITVLIRSDIFSRLSTKALADSVKMRGDFSIELDWRILSGQPARAALFTLLNSKSTALIGGESIDIVSTYLPKDVQMGGRGGSAPRWMDIYKYLLDLTRHTPRDILQLFEWLRTIAASEEFSATNTGDRLSREIIREAVLQYSTKYFVDAVKNELVGRDQEMGDLVDDGMSALRQMPRSTFTLRDFVQECFDSSAPEDMRRGERFLRWLFIAGAIGNAKPSGRESYLQFYHRRDEADVYLKGNLILHSALVYAFNTPR